MSYVMSGKGAPSAVSDKMKFGVKPSAVRSSSFLKVQKAASPSGNQTMSLGNQIIFDIPNLGTGYYIDWSTSYFRFGVNVQLGHDLIVASDANPTPRKNNGYVRFERGPESMFRRIEIQDYGGGNDLENFENYNDLYCATELMTSNSALRSKCGMYHGEGLLLPHNHFGHGDGNLGLIGSATGGQDAVYWTPAGGTEKYQGITNIPLVSSCNPMDNYNGGYHAEIPYLRYPDLGGIVAAHRNVHSYTVGATYNADGTYYSSSSSADQVDVELDFTRFMEATQAIDATASPYGTIGNPASNVKYVTFQTVSSLFGGCADKYLPMSAINGFRYIFTLDNPEGAFVCCGLNGNLAKDLTVTIVDPTLVFNCVYVDPMVDQALLSSARDAQTRSIRIASQSWRSYSYVIPKGIPSFEQLIPIRVSSLKAIYFTFSRAFYNGVENFDSFAYPQLNSDSKTTWFDNCLTSYQFIMDGSNIGSPNPTYLRKGYSEAITELERSLHIGHKSADGNYLSLICNTDLSDYRYRNFILGQEFESFSNKGPVIESGMNTINSQLSLKLTFDNEGAVKNIPSTVLCPGDALPASEYDVSAPNGPATCYLKIFCLFDVFLNLEPDKTMKLEY